MSIYREPSPRLHELPPMRPGAVFAACMDSLDLGDRWRGLEVIAGRCPGCGEPESARFCIPGCQAVFRMLFGLRERAVG